MRAIGQRCAAERKSCNRHHKGRGTRSQRHTGTGCHKGRVKTAIAGRVLLQMHFAVLFSFFSGGGERAIHFTQTLWDAVSLQIACELALASPTHRLALAKVTLVMVQRLSMGTCAGIAERDKETKRRRERHGQTQKHT